MNIRNFCIIAHIDHGKSTLADRMLEATHAVEARKMQPQYLDRMALERERGITIKMQPVRMAWKEYVLNLIDTPGHVDFSYEVSRALAAVEGAILLVDAAKGIQAQTVANFELARRQGLVIIPAINKIDLPQARPEAVSEEVAALLQIDPSEVFRISAKEGKGVEELLNAVVARVPSPRGEPNALGRALIFDSYFDAYRGVIAHVRIVDGSFSQSGRVMFAAKKLRGEILELGVFVPEEKKVQQLSSGEIGWLATGIKVPDFVRVGDTIAEIHPGAILPLSGYKEPQSVVFASLYPESEDDFEKLRESLDRLKLNDASFSFEPEQSQALGRGFRCGFLGLLHMDIVMERLRRDFSSTVVATSPSVRFRVLLRSGEELVIHTAKDLPDRGSITEIKEPWVRLSILLPPAHLASALKVLSSTRARVGETRTLGEDRVALEAEAPLLDVMQDFADKLKSATKGFASFSWEEVADRAGDLVPLEILVAHEEQEAFTKIVPRDRAEREARLLVDRLKDVLPRQLFEVAIQGSVEGRVVARETLPALRKDVTGYLYGGDFSRKKKLLEKQRKGKKRMQKTGRVHIPADVYQKMLRYDTK